MNDHHTTDLSLPQFAMGLCIAAGSIYATVKLFKKLEASIISPNGNYEVNRFYQQLITQSKE